MLYLSCSSAKTADSRAIQLQESMSNRIEVHAGDKAVGADRGGEFEGVGACREKRRSATLKSPVSNTSEMFFSSTNTKRAPGFCFLAQARISGERSRPVVAEFGKCRAEKVQP